MASTTQMKEPGLRLTVVACKDLPKMDRVGWCDAYVVTSFEGVGGVLVQRYRTPVVKNSRDPVFDFRIEPDASVVASTRSVRFEVMDKDILSRDDFVGAVVLSKSDWKDGQVQDWTLALRHKGVERGKLVVRVDYLSVERVFREEKARQEELEAGFARLMEEKERLGLQQMLSKYAQISSSPPWYEFRDTSGGVLFYNAKLFTTTNVRPPGYRGEDASRGAKADEASVPPYWSGCPDQPPPAYAAVDSPVPGEDEKWAAAVRQVVEVTGVEPDRAAAVLTAENGDVRAAVHTLVLSSSG